MSVTVLLGLLFLSVTKSFQCTTEDDIEIPCTMCERPIPGGNEGDIYQCDGFKDAFEVALEGYSHGTVWLVFAAFQLGYAVETTGLGKRISLLLIKYLGRSLLGLGYALCFSEMLLGPFIPSNTARGSVVMAIATSIARTLGSTPTKKPVTGGGEYLMLVGGHANLIAASMYQTGMAANPIISDKAQEILGIEWGFTNWLLGSWVPSIIAFLLLPLIIKLFSKASVDVGQVRAMIDGDLRALGPLKKQEKVLLFTLLCCLGLWVSSSFTGLDATFIALSGVAFLLVTETVKWSEMLKNEDAWDTTIWLGGLVLMADQLTELGIAKWIGDGVANALGNLSPVGATMVLAVVYFYSMYIFCSLTGHIVAFVGPFLEAGKVLGAPPYLLVALISYFSTLCGCLTNYSTGPIVLYFGQKYSTTKVWFTVGFLMSFAHIGVWFTFGMGWWKILGWY